MAACAEKPEPANSNAKAAAKNAAKPSVYADYRSWKPVNAEPIAVPGRRLTLCEPFDPNREKTDSPHDGGFVNIYVNPAGREAYVPEGAPEFAAGTVIVKEKLLKKDAAKPHSIGVMIKREAGFATDDGDWQYVYVDGKGNVTEAKATLRNCANCHQTQADKDYVFRRVPLTSNGNQE